MKNKKNLNNFTDSSWYNTATNAGIVADVAGNIIGYKPMRNLGRGATIAGGLVGAIKSDDLGSKGVYGGLAINTLGNVIGDAQIENSNIIKNIKSQKIQNGLKKFGKGAKVAGLGLTIAGAGKMIYDGFKKSQENSFSDQEIELLSNYSDSELISFSSRLNNFLLSNFGVVKAGRIRKLLEKAIEKHDTYASLGMKSEASQKQLASLKDKVNKLYGDYYKEAHKRWKPNFELKEDLDSAASSLVPNVEGGVKFINQGDYNKALQKMKDVGRIPNKKNITLDTIRDNYWNSEKQFGANYYLYR